MKRIYSVENEMKPDIKASFKYFGNLPKQTGIRFPVKVEMDYLTTSVIDFIHTALMETREAVEVYVTFITPDVYPHSLWTGKKLDVHVGSKVCGELVVTKVLNPLLDAELYFTNDIKREIVSKLVPRKYYLLPYGIYISDSTGRLLEKIGFSLLKDWKFIDEMECFEDIFYKGNNLIVVITTKDAKQYEVVLNEKILVFGDLSERALNHE